MRLSRAGDLGLPPKDLERERLLPIGSFQFLWWENSKRALGYSPSGPPERTWARRSLSPGRAATLCHVKTGPNHPVCRITTKSSRACSLAHHDDPTSLLGYWPAGAGPRPARRDSAASEVTAAGPGPAGPGAASQSQNNVSWLSERTWRRPEAQFNTENMN